MATYVRTQTVEHEIGEDGLFGLSVTSADTQLRATPGGTVRLRATFEIQAGSDAQADAIFEAIRMRVVAGSGSLRVEEARRRSSSSLGSAISRLLGAGDDVELTVFAEIPAAAAVRFEGVSADVQASGLIGEQRYATVSGDLFLTDSGGSARVNTVSGDVTLRSEDHLAVRADSVSGDLNVVAPRLDSMRANAVSGDIDVEGHLDPAGEFRFETVSGDLTVGLLGGGTFIVRGLSSEISSDIDHRIEGQADRRRLVIGDGAPEVLFGSMSGDLSVRRPRRLEATAATPATPAPRASASDADQLAVLRALERGEISVDEATRRLSGEGPAGA